MRQVYRDNGYQEVKGPQILDQGLWEKTGHWDKYRENMFTTESEKRDYALKPMNCPGHILIFKQGIKSYRDLPLRYGEFGQCHRNEPTGGLHGIMRVRAFTQDDGHIFCTEDQIQAECVAFTALLQKVYRRLRLHRHHLQGGHAARKAHRLRRELGQGRAALMEPAASAATSSICRATAPSTARRSSTR
jgi:threonyl-tRNA synthetase